MKKAVLVWLLSVVVLTSTAAVADQSSDEAAIRAMIDKVWEQVGAKKYQANDLHPDGVRQATSQGGLWATVDRAGQKTLLNDSPNALNVSARHVEVKFLGAKKDAAYVSFYLIGTITRASGETIPNYRTRASWAMEKVSGNWVVSGAHYSPLYGGSGVRFD